MTLMRVIKLAFSRRSADQEREWYSGAIDDLSDRIEQMNGTRKKEHAETMTAIDQVTSVLQKITKAQDK